MFRKLSSGVFAGWLVLVLLALALAGCDKKDSQGSEGEEKAAPATVESACENQGKIIPKGYDKDKCVAMTKDLVAGCGDKGQDLVECLAKADGPVALGDCMFMCRKDLEQPK